MDIKILLVPHDSSDWHPESWVTVKDTFIKDNFKSHVADYIISKGEINVPLEVWVKLGLPVLTKTKVIAPPLEFKETKFL